jgi:hypothetical protein
MIEYKLHIDEALVWTDVPTSNSSGVALRRKGSA